jgi:arylformamidase
MDLKVQQLIDVSHTVEHGMTTYPGIPAPSITDFLTRSDSREHYAKGTEFYIGKIEMAANTGTYVDSPFHRYAGGKDLSELPLDSLANLEGIVIRCPFENGSEVDKYWLEKHDIRRKAVLIHTGWDRHWRKEQYFKGHPYLTKEAADFLLHEGAVLVGIDSLNIDDTNNPARPVHSILLGADIPIVEHLCNLQSVPDRGFTFFAVPVKIRSFGSFPVRAFCIIMK